MIVGSKKDGINVADLVAGKDGARLIPRLLTDGTYALSDASKTDPETSEAHAILATWTTNNTPSYLTGLVSNALSASSILIKQGDSVYAHLGGRGDGALTMPADNVFRFSIGPASGTAYDLAGGRRRSQIAPHVVQGATSGQTAWCSYCCVLGDTDGADSGAEAQTMQWQQTGTGFAPPVEISVVNGEFGIYTRSSASTYPTGSGRPVTHYSAPVPDKGVKDYFVQQVTFGASGHINVWRNGTQIVNADTPIGYYAGASAGTVLGWFCTGLYASASLNSDTAYIANPEWSFNTLADRITTPLPVPDLDWS
jgi:hypothetical protein